jgi:hypothetical protein
MSLASAWLSMRGSHKEYVVPVQVFSSSRDFITTMRRAFIYDCTSQHVCLRNPVVAPNNGNPNKTYPLLNTRDQNCSGDASAALYAETGKILSGDWVGTTATGVLVKAFTAPKLIAAPSAMPVEDNPPTSRPAQRVVGGCCRPYPSKHMPRPNATSTQSMACPSDTIYAGRRSSDSAKAAA